MKADPDTTLYQQGITEGGAHTHRACELGDSATVRMPEVG